MIKCFIISTGTELLTGYRKDANAAYLSTRLADMGMEVAGICVIEDRQQAIEKIFSTGLEIADIVICSGGMGSTGDDLSKTSVCEVLQCSLEMRQDVADRIQAYFAHEEEMMPPHLLRLAMFPRDAVILKNDIGTAPGMYMSKGKKRIILLPGPPAELQAMFRQEVEPRLAGDFSLEKSRIERRVIKTYGARESKIEALLDDRVSLPPGVQYALLAVQGEVHILLQAGGKDRDDRRQMLEQVSREIHGMVGDFFFGYNDDTLESIVRELLIKSGITITAAESCTGGLLAQSLTSLPGSSEYFWGSFVSYSNEAKMEMLDVCRQTLDSFGAVSEQVAKEMALGALKRSRAQLSVAITGNAGPTTLEAEKPVGLVFIALATAETLQVSRMHFAGSRCNIRKHAAKSALSMIKDHLQKSISCRRDTM